MGQTGRLVAVTYHSSLPVGQDPWKRRSAKRAPTGIKGSLEHDGNLVLTKDGILENPMLLMVPESLPLPLRFEFWPPASGAVLFTPVLCSFMTSSPSCLFTENYSSAVLADGTRPAVGDDVSLRTQNLLPSALVF